MFISYFYILIASTCSSDSSLSAPMKVWNVFAIFFFLVFAHSLSSVHKSSLTLKGQLFPQVSCSWPLDNRKQHSKQHVLQRMMKNTYLLPRICEMRKYLKLYCRYEHTKPCMINRIWGLKQLWLQVNGHAWFHLQRLRWPVRNGEGAKNSKWKYMSPAGFEPTPRQSTTGKSAH